MLYLSQDTPKSAVLYAHTSTGGALSGILYFALLLSQYYSCHVNDGFFEGGVTSNELGPYSKAYS